MNTGALTIQAALARRDIVLDLQIPAGQVVAVLGPNGAGKSTLLSLISGLIRPDRGRIVLDERVLVDVEVGAWVPTHRRGVVLLAQQAMLFPHLSAAANVAFGPRSQGRSRARSRTLAEHWLEAVGAGDLADRKPGQLSGGQAQRVAVARALAADPAVLLLDEPMAALDIAAAPAVRQLLRTVLRDSGRTAILVTHDILDALALADRVIVLEGGRVAEDGPVREVLARPRSSFGARIAGVNLIPGTTSSDGLIAADGTHIFGMLDPLCGPDEPAVAVFHPNAVAVHLTPPTGSPRNHVAVTIAEIEPRDTLIRIRSTQNLDGSAGLFADLTAAAVADLNIIPGQRVYFAVKATEVSVYPAAENRPAALSDRAASFR